MALPFDTHKPAGNLHVELPLRGSPSTLHVAGTHSHLGSWKLTDSPSFQVLLTIDLSSHALFFQALTLPSLSGSLTFIIDSVHEILPSTADSDTWAFPKMLASLTSSSYTCTLCHSCDTMCLAVILKHEHYFFSLKDFFLILCVWTFIWMCVCASCSHLVSAEARRGRHIPRNWSRDYCDSQVTAESRRILCKNSQCSSWLCCLSCPTSCSWRAKNPHSPELLEWYFKGLKPNLTLAQL